MASRAVRTDPGDLHVELLADPAAERALVRARQLVRWADQRFLDPIVGLVVPGLGDTLGAVLGLYMITVGMRCRVPRIVLARMLLNLAVDALTGLVPIVGDLFDFGFRAHRRNLALLESRLREGPAHGRPGDWLVVVGALLLFLLALAAPLLLLVWGVSRLARP
jgi:hypothetical protein